MARSKWLLLTILLVVLGTYALRIQGSRSRFEPLSEPAVRVSQAPAQLSAHAGRDGEMNLPATHSPPRPEERGQALGFSQDEQVQAILHATAGKELFDLLYSNRFQEESGWRKAKATLTKRLQAPLPGREGGHGFAGRFDQEVVARLGILKALGRVGVSAESAGELKQILFSYLESARGQPWALQREAAGALIRQKLVRTPQEEAKLARLIDARARSLATQTDFRILSQVVEGEAHD